MNIQTYYDKVYGCWMGKNIGGTLGAPFECIRGVYDLEAYTEDMSGGAAPNDDLDLQLIWLNAAEKYGKSLNAEILGEYWLTNITANWSEYGACKANLRKGLLPPLSGWYHNHNRNSNGCFIRSELWACLAPGHPEIAVQYAYEDAIVDHSDEAVYAEIFTAAIESAAFVVSDRDKLIDIGLSYITDNCAISEVIELVYDCYDNGLDWKTARKKVLNAFPTAFGMYRGYVDQDPEEDVEVGILGYDAPANIGLLVIGWLYGEGDFGKSICIAAGCAEDGDCTAATLGSIMGIIMGAKSMPDEWTKPIGDKIKTISLDVTNYYISIPSTLTQLTERVCRLMPVFMGDNYNPLADSDEVISLLSEDDLYNADIPMGPVSLSNFKYRLDEQPFGISKESCLLRAVVYIDGGPDICSEGEKTIRIRMENRLLMQQWLKLRWFIPEGWTVSTGRESSLFLDQYHGGYGNEYFELTIAAPVLNEAEYNIVLEISSLGRASRMYFPITFINKPSNSLTPGAPQGDY